MYGIISISYIYHIHYFLRGMISFFLITNILFYSALPIFKCSPHKVSYIRTAQLCWTCVQRGRELVTEPVLGTANVSFLAHPWIQQTANWPIIFSYCAYLEIPVQRLLCLFSTTIHLLFISPSTFNLCTILIFYHSSFYLFDSLVISTSTLQGMIST